MLYRRPPDEAEVTRLGLALEDVEPPAFEVWEENWPIVQFFASLSTQWRHGMAGPTGLDYASVLAMLRFRRLARAEQVEWMDAVQAMERAALEVIHAKD